MTRLPRNYGLTQASQSIATCNHQAATNGRNDTDSQQATRKEVTMETRVCKKCGCELPVEDFYWQDTKKAKRRLTCRFCDIERIMRNKKRDPDYQVKHQAKPVYAKRKPRVANGKGDRREYSRKYYQEHKAELTAKNHADYIQRKLSIVVERKPIHTQVPEIVANCPTCKDNCANYPCFTGIDNMSCNLAMTCHGFKPKEK